MSMSGCIIHGKLTPMHKWTEYWTNRLCEGEKENATECLDGCMRAGKLDLIKT